MTTGDWLAFWPQCGDTYDYLDIGRACAESGACYDTLRPVISVLWFSLPYRLGWPPESLILLHAALLALACVQWGQWLARVAGRAGWLPVTVGSVLVAAVAVPFLRPTFFHALSDVPAALCLLMGVGLALRAETTSGWPSALRYLLAGLLLGLAAGLRVFYLYPVLVQLAVVAGLVACLRPDRGGGRPLRLWLLVALLPMLMQVRATWLYSGEISYLPSADTRYWSNVHRYSNWIGYDTLYPEEPYPWYGKPECQGLWPAAAARDWQGMACTLSGRLYFLLGSYSPRNYIETGRLEWERYEIDPRLNPVGLKGPPDWPFLRTQGAGRFELLPASKPPWALRQETLIEQAGPVTLSITLREPGLEDGRPAGWLQWGIQGPQGQWLGRDWLQPGPALERRHAHFTVSVPGRYVVVLGSSLERPGPVRLEAGDFIATRGWHEEPYPMAPERVRQWHPGWLALQLGVLAVVLVAGWLPAARQAPVRASWALLPLLVLGQSLVIVPEQRFVILMEIALWLGLLLWLAHLSAKTR